MNAISKQDYLHHASAAPSVLQQREAVVSSANQTAQPRSCMLKIAKYVLYDILRNRIVLGYAAFLFVAAITFFNLEGDSTKSVMSLLNIVLIMAPLVSVIFSTIHFYNSYEFIELLVAQPVSRRAILGAEYAGVGGALVAAFLFGIGLPVVVFSPDSRGFTLLATGVLLTLVFVSLAFLAAVLTRDKARGIGLALLLWFCFSILYDGLVLVLLFAFSDYPLEKPTLVLTFLNPVDLSRILMLLQLDVSALMGYTGAVFNEFLGSTAGVALAYACLVLWVLLPMFWAERVFRKKDL
ncbi:MAG TPA: ABC transporter permease subunit [Saprospiraceae bacterium]|nr:ABC transporter permease subunit [Saprospiraceae bacterium]HNM26482.1 ABC transporter permease subunit [Saprospiraceae bacterium]